MKTLHVPAEARKWVYRVALALIPIAVAYGWLQDEMAPLWVALIAAILAPGLALANITPDPTAEQYWAGLDTEDTPQA